MVATWQRIRPLLLWAGLVLLVWGAKLWLIDHYGSSLPVMDQIDGEGEMILRPWQEDRLEAVNFWHPHNEHRIVLTRLYTLGLTALNGQWDAEVQVVVNALLHAMFVPVLLAWLHRRVRGLRFALLAAGTTLLWVLPLNWENTLQGFQSQFYFLIWLSFLQLRGVLGTERLGWRWAGGQLCGLLALGTMGSGFMASAIVIVVVGWDAWQRRAISRYTIATLALSALWLAVGLATRHHVAGHDYLRADTLGDVVSVLFQILTWPMQQWLPWAVIFALPLATWAGVLLWRNDRSGWERVALGLAGWVLLNALSIAIYRNDGVGLSSRYLDVYMLGLVLQGAALAVMQPPRWPTVALALWLVAVSFAVIEPTRDVLRRTLPARAAHLAEQEERSRAYFADPGPTHFAGLSYPQIPHPVGAVLHDRWQHEIIQRLMPADVRRSLEIAPPIMDGALDGLPPTPFPVLVASPLGPQTEPWFWRSAPYPAAETGPILRFRILGALGDPEAELALRIHTAGNSWDIIPDGPARQRWKTINVPRPADDWWIEIEDNDSLDRFVMTAPVELGWLSWAAGKLAKHHFWWFSAGLICTVLGGVLPRAAKE